MPIAGGTDSGREPAGIGSTGFKLGGEGGPDGTCD